jgi:hypothetical protein
MPLTVPFIITVTPKRRTVEFGEPQWTDLEPIDVCYLLDAPQPIMNESSFRYTQDGKLYARRGVDLKDGDMVPLPIPRQPKPADFGVIGDAQLDFVHPMTGYDFGWVRFHIRRGA